MINPEQIIKEPKGEIKEADKSSLVESKEIGKESQVEMFTMQQQLINQYMHLNIQLLSKKLENLEHVDKTVKQEEPSPQVEVKSNKKKMYILWNAEKKLTIAVTLIANTMPKGCAIIATINMAEQRNHGIVLMINYTQMGCAKIAT